MDRIFCMFVNHTVEYRARVTHVYTRFQVYGYTSIFFCHFCKGEKFSLLSVCFSGGQSLPKDGVFSCKSKFFPYEMTPIHMGDNNINDRVASPESAPIHLKAASQ